MSSSHEPGGATGSAPWRPDLSLGVGAGVLAGWAFAQLRACCAEKPAPGCGHQVDRNTGRHPPSFPSSQLPAPMDPRDNSRGKDFVGWPLAPLAGGSAAPAPQRREKLETRPILCLNPLQILHVSLRVSRVELQNFSTMDEWSKTKIFFKINVLNAHKASKKGTD